jgi:hypothetical protein
VPVPVEPALDRDVEQPDTVPPVTADARTPPARRMNRRRFTSVETPAVAAPLQLHGEVRTD